jgi:hypothetical protein
MTWIRRTIRIMTELSRYAFPILASLALVIPPGSCGVAAAGVVARTGVERLGCCHHKLSERACEELGSPTGPNVHCCCAGNVGLAGKSFRPLDSRDLCVAFVGQRDWQRVAGDPPTVAAYRFAPSGPRLQILLCVWRC